MRRMHDDKEVVSNVYVTESTLIVNNADGSHNEYEIQGGGEPTNYLKNATVSGNTLTLIKKDNTTIEFTPTGGGELTPETLLEVLEGSDSVVVDLNETDDKVQVRLDQDVLSEIDSKLDASKSAVASVGGLVVPTSAPTDTVLVGIATDREQLNIYLGDGLEIDEDNVLSATGGIEYTAGDNITILNHVISATSAIPGPQGPQGIQGIQGPKGETGEQGPQGIQGLQGPKGDDGADGEDGVGVYSSLIDSTGHLILTYTDSTVHDAGYVKGEKGETGDTGPQGPQGEQGEQGIQGIQGIQGEKGETGETGPQGPQGIQGLQGPQGPAGADGEDGSQVSVSSTGTSTNEVNYITIDDTEYKLAGGGTEYTAGSGIDITDETISADSTIARVEDIPDITGLATEDYVDTAVATKSTVSGTNDGTNWTSLTVDGTTKNIPAGSTDDYIYIDKVLTASSSKVIIVDSSLTEEQYNTIWGDHPEKVVFRCKWYVHDNFEETYLFKYTATSYSRSYNCAIFNNILKMYSSDVYDMATLGITVSPNQSSNFSASISSIESTTTAMYTMSASENWPNSGVFIPPLRICTSKAGAEGFAGRDYTLLTKKAVKEYINDKVPDAPSSDGNYVLKCSVVSGTATYSWESLTSSESEDF